MATAEIPPNSFEALLNGLQLQLALAPIQGKPVCTRTLQRWCARGMPFRLHPVTRRRRYLFSEVYAWLVGTPASLCISQASLDRSVIHPRRRGVSA